MISLLTYWKPIAIALAIAVVFGYGYLKGMQAEQAEWQEARIRQMESNLIANSEVSNELQKNHSATRTRHDAVRVRASGNVYVAPSGRCDETARNHGVLGDVGQNVTKLMRDAELQTQQLKACQDWIRRVTAR